MLCNLSLIRKCYETPVRRDYLKYSPVYIKTPSSIFWSILGGKLWLPFIKKNIILQ